MEKLTRGALNLILETERLFLRELRQTDFRDLAEILQNPKVMYAYEYDFSDDDVYLQAAQTELQEAVRGRKEMAETDCTEVGLTEKSKATAGEKVRERQIRI